MKLNKNSQILYKNNDKEMIAKTTDLCIAAHHDDIEIMAYGPISKCYNSSSDWFAGVVITDGANSPRSGVYSDYSNEQMKQVRIKEQFDASVIGNYSAQICLGYPSTHLYSTSKDQIISDIMEIILKAQPKIIYTHNLADKHKTHVASALLVLEAIKRLPKDKQPQKVYGLEVWRGLDWLPDTQKVCFDTSKYPNIAKDIIRVYDSQINGGKKYDSAALGRRIANATFFESHNVDTSDSLSYGIDLTPIITEEMDCVEFINNHINMFKDEVNKLLNSILK